ncbi:hypothetical protein FE784_35040 [Paenibacillus hemerocallicola]|uniref:Uncharacterized protein n=1 Tax=Paenibacillus hemerocallicola TaxID=1172614 RepID=A0A5C4SY46_9BACL|nr:hypothetical protein [Paenibacillus hemerocallicola]TNJ61019.1 hypothetical protein FE784_35040 [Paenibacillus hemerocallicola]
MAGTNAEEGFMVMISNFNVAERRVTLNFEGENLAGKTYKVDVIDAQKTCELADTGILNSNTLLLRMPKYSVFIVSVR